VLGRGYSVEEVDAFVAESERSLELLEARRILYTAATEAARVRVAAQEKALHLLLEAVGEAEAIRYRAEIDRKWMAQTCASVGELSAKLDAALAVRLGHEDGIHITIELSAEESTTVRSARTGEHEASTPPSAPQVPSI
jgi:hypothetical protein